MEELIMVSGQSLKLECVKFKNHDKSCQELEDLIYKMNDIIYFFSRKIINKTARSYILTEFEKIGTKAKDLADSPRKEEMLAALRHYYKVVRNAEIGEDNAEQITKLIAYGIAKSIKVKNEKRDAEKQLTENRMIFDLYIKPIYNSEFSKSIPNIRTFCALQKELQEMLVDKYTFKTDCYDCDWS